MSREGKGKKGDGRDEDKKNKRAEENSFCFG